MLCGWRARASGPLWSLLAKTETSTFFQAPGVCPRQARPCSRKFTSYRTKGPLEVVLYHSPFRGQGTQVWGRLSPDHPVGYAKARLSPAVPTPNALSTSVPSLGLMVTQSLEGTAGIPGSQPQLPEHPGDLVLFFL